MFDDRPKCLIEDIQLGNVISEFNLKGKNVFVVKLL